MKSPAHDYPPLIAAIAVHGAADAIEFYKNAFGATERYRLVDPETGKIGHCELTLNGGMIMVSDENPQWNKSPQTLNGTTVKFVLMVGNADAAIEKAVAAGATALMPPSNMFYGYRCGTVCDPFGHHWLLEHVVEEVSRRRCSADGMRCRRTANLIERPVMKKPIIEPNLFFASRCEEAVAPSPKRSGE